jgi:hypothetical protein
LAFLDIHHQVLGPTGLVDEMHSVMHLTAPLMVRADVVFACLTPLPTFNLKLFQGGRLGDDSELIELNGALHFANAQALHYWGQEVCALGQCHERAYKTMGPCIFAYHIHIDNVNNEEEEEIYICSSRLGLIKKCVTALDKAANEAVPF